MLILLSPAKTLDFDPSPVSFHSEPEHMAHTEVLVGSLRKKSARSLGKLMSLSDNLAELNAERYREFQTPFVLNEGAKQSLLAFKGDVYRDWPLEEYAQADFEYAQSHLRILSGLYGALRPMDLIRPYRLEMGTRLRTRRGKDLYAFWGSRIRESIEGLLETQQERIVVNLASNEYSRAAQLGKLDAQVVSPVFKDWKRDRYKLISFFAKRARGMMAHYLIKNRVHSMNTLHAFDQSGYHFDPDSSTPEAPVFLRKVD